MSKIHEVQLELTIGFNDSVQNDEKFSHFVFSSIRRHLQGDWGDLCKEDWEENELSLREGFRVLSAYNYNDEKIWIITEADRSVTTVLFPSEY